MFRIPYGRPWDNQPLVYRDQNGFEDGALGLRGAWCDTGPDITKCGMKYEISAYEQTWILDRFDSMTVVAPLTEALLLLLPMAVK